MGRSRKRRSAAARERARRNRTGMITITFVVSILFVVLLFQGIRMKKQIVENDIRQQELQSAIAAEERRYEAADEARAYLETEEFIKDTAHDRLGLVEDDEIVFKPKK